MTTLETPPAAEPRLLGLGVGAAVLTLLLAVIVALHALPFGSPAVWTWDYQPLTAPSRLLFALVPPLAAWLVLIGVEQRRRKATRHAGVKTVASLWLAAFVSVQAIMLMNPLGYAYPATLVINPASNSYFGTALHHPETAALLRDFPRQMPTLVSHAQTQSAGPIVFSSAVARLADASPLTPVICDTLLALSPGTNPDALADYCRHWEPNLTANQVRAALVVALAMIALGSLAVAPLYWLGNRLGGPGTGVFAALGFVLLPAFNVFSVSVDQMYPCVTALALCGIWRGLQAERRSALWFALIGVWLGCGLFMNMGLIVALALCGAFALLCAPASGKSARELLVGAGAFVVGVLVPVGALKLVWGYDLFAVFTTSNALRDALYYNARSYAQSLWANPLDFFVFCGLPLVFLWLWHLRAMPKTRWNLKTLDPRLSLALAFCFMLLLLDASGRVRGEVARMWMFLTPPLLIGAGTAWYSVWNASRRVAWGLLVLQGIQLGVLQYFVRVWGY